MANSTILIGVARSEAFSARVALLALGTATNVASEDPATADHASRIKFANAILTAGYNNKLLAAIILASNGTIANEAIADAANDGAAVPDSDLQFALASLVTAIGKALP